MKRKEGRRGGEGRRGMVTIADKLVKPSTSVGYFVNFCPKASLKLCAGSVEMINTLSLTLLICTAMLELTVVLPTPPK